MTISFEPCKPTKEDARLIMDWRNDPHTLSMSYHNQPKKWPDFYVEYNANYFLDNEMTPLFALTQGKKVGFIKLDREINPLNASEIAANISINISPEMRGMGLGSATLKNLNYYLNNNSAIRLAIAEIKENNQASINTFSKAGYVFFDKKLKYIEDINCSYQILRMIHPISNDSLKTP